MTVRGGEGADRISMHGLEGNVLDGGPGDDVITSEVFFPTSPSGPGDSLLGGDGNDRINTRNDRRDIVRCGDGSDQVTADDLDDVAADCETVSLPPGSPWARADGRPVGVSIHDGAASTTKRHVRLLILAPDAATHVRISSGSGFDTWATKRVKRNEVYSYVLASSRGEPSTRTVYVRFDGAGLDPSRTFSDDILLDEKRAR